MSAPVDAGSPTTIEHEEQAAMRRVLRNLLTGLAALPIVIRDLQAQERGLVRPQRAPVPLEEAISR